MADPKNNAYDGKGTLAGNISSDPEQNTVDKIADEAGINVKPGEAIETKSKLEARDENRWELNPDSARDRAAQ